MSVIFRMQRNDLIGAVIIDVDGRDDDEDNMYDLTEVVLKRVNGTKIRIRVDRFEDMHLDIDEVR